ncbi:hemolysin family protein [Brochothrix thermosphacta]|uniref:hemolysin family protein n=1 Tax=Brochothrix thermosphacta TaxID=2756 RepID=UPI0039B06257
MIFNLLAIVILIFASAFFVATEFAVVKMRGSRLEQLVEEGKPNAKMAKHIHVNLDAYLSACQLGITLSSLGLGWLGEPAVARLITPIFNYFELPSTAAHLISFILAFSIITYLHVVIGELVPKTLAIQKTEQVTLAVAQPLNVFYRIMYPFIWFLNHSARGISRLFGLDMSGEHDVAHTEEELRFIANESFKSGEINQSEYGYLNKIFEFDDRLAKEVMVPRTEIVTVSINSTIDEASNMTLSERYTRYPVIDGDKDNVVGVLNLKDLLSIYVTGNLKPSDTIESLVKPIIRVIETIPINDLLLKMQKERNHMAILLDEYGGTEGLVTAEDILEEIVGDIRDEFDVDEISEITKIADDHYVVEGKVLIDEINNLLHTSLDEDDVDTIGGWFLTQKYDSKQGDQIIFDGYIFTIKEIEDHHVSFIEITKSTQPVAEIDEEA